MKKQDIVNHHAAPQSPGLRCRLLGSVALTALCAMPVSAQQSDAAAGQDVIVLDEIVIQARRITEDLQKAPVAVTVQTEDDLGTGNLDEFSDLSDRAPNTYAFDSNGRSYVVRGVGSQSVQGMNGEVGVGVFVDEVYLGRAEAAPLYLGDVAQTEIVRGSQSTIYGRNTIGGAVNLTTRRPGDVPGGNVEASYGTDGYYRLQGAVDMPLDKEGRWLSRSYLSFTRKPDGIDNIATGQDDLALEALSGRFTLTGELGDSTSVLFTADHERVKDEGLSGWAPIAMSLDHRSDLDFPADRDDRRGGAMLKIEHDFGGFWFNSITAWREFSQKMTLDGDFTAGPYDPASGAYELQQGQDQRQHQFSQEFRIGSHPVDRLQAGELAWNAGVFMMTDRYDGVSFYDLVSVPREQTSRNMLDARSRAWSVFGNLNYQATEQLTVNAGLRYSYERREGDAAVESASGTYFYGMPQSGSVSVTSRDLSPEFGLQYRLDENSMVFGRVAKGFKSGGIAQFFDAEGRVNSYDPEKSITYELGLKTQLLDGRLALDAMLFHTDWEDMQANVFISDFNRVTANAASARSRGFELGLAAQLSDEFRLRGSYGYLDAKFDEFRYGFHSQATGGTRTLDYSGNPIPLAPRHSLNLTLDWEHQLQNGLTAVATGSYTYRDSMTFDPEANYRQPETHLLDASFGLKSDEWEARVWGRNLLDEDYLNNYFLFMGQDYGIAEPGRTIGLTLSRRW